MPQKRVIHLINTALDKWANVSWWKRGGAFCGHQFTARASNIEPYVTQNPDEATCKACRQLIDNRVTHYFGYLSSGYDEEHTHGVCGSAVPQILRSTYVTNEPKKVTCKSCLKHPKLQKLLFLPKEQNPESISPDHVKLVPIGKDRAIIHIKTKLLSREEAQVLKDFIEERLKGFL